MRTALVAIGRRENNYAREWVEHHLALGFDHIFIYDNNHKGEEHFEDVVGGYVSDGKVTIIDWRNIERAQRSAYNHAYQSLSLSPDYDWVAFFDFDEFLCFPAAHATGTVAEAAEAATGTVAEGGTQTSRGNRSAPTRGATGTGAEAVDAASGTGAEAAEAASGTVAEAAVADGSPSGLKTFLATIPQEYHAVMIPWLTMTDNGLVRNDHRPLMKRFTESTTRGCQQGKCIIRTGIIGARFTKSVHVPYTPTLRCCNPRLQPTAQHRLQPRDTSVAYLKHFSTKTIEEWLTNKWQKGAAGCSYEKFQRQYADYFFSINERTPEKEAFIREWNEKQKVKI